MDGNRAGSSFETSSHSAEDARITCWITISRKAVWETECAESGQPKVEVRNRHDFSAKYQVQLGMGYEQLGSWIEIQVSHLPDDPDCVPRDEKANSLN